MKDKFNKRAFGSIGEDAAVEYLKKNGLTIVERNFRTRRGEVDIIARDKDTIVFVEVKMRSFDSMTEPESAVDYKKQSIIRKTAELYLCRHNLINRFYCRFDVIGIKISKDGKFNINWLKNAF